MSLPLEVKTQDNVLAAQVRNVLANGGTWTDMVPLEAASGTASDTISGVGTAVSGVDGTGSNAASKADVDTRLSAINNNLKSLAVKVNQLIVLVNNVNA
jgi:hypothetical protein